LTIESPSKILSVMEDTPTFSDLLKERIYTVSQITLRLKDTIEEEFGYEYVWLSGEVTNFRGNYASGHWYFSLKDDNAQISAVCFKWANQDIKFVPEDGMEVICAGQIGVYEKQGVYQVNIKHMEPKGVGAQALALEQLREKLFKEGLFALERKRPLPSLPQKIGIVTSPTGAAVKDILKVLDRRFPNLEIIISPARVQGDEAPADIVSALKKIYLIKGIDLVILARGGGSKEDLFSFNDEAVVREIVNAPVPVISAVGHEIDFTLSDLAADLRAATPSMAAELAVREKTELTQELLHLKGRLGLTLKNTIEAVSREVDQMQSELVYLFKSKLGNASLEFSALSGKLDALSPLKVMERGYSITYKLPSMKTVKDSGKLKTGDRILINFAKGKAKCSVDETQE
jgi:exodeoxyribonuclease VII large subunit